MTPSSPYNSEEYQHLEVKDTQLEHSGQDIVDALDFNPAHQRYETVWAGMDVGFTSDPSEILIFAEYDPTAAERKADKAAGRISPEEGLSRVKCICRVSLKRMPHPMQAKAILHVIES